MKANVSGQQVVKIGQVEVSYPAGFDAYGEAIARLLEATIEACSQKFGFRYESPILVEMKSSDRLALWVAAPEPKITWQFCEERHLQPPNLTEPQKGGPWNVYGFIHELGHLVVWIEDALELGQGWADYFAFTLMPLVWERLDESAWPIPHNYWALEQERRKGWEQEALSNPNSSSAASWYFWQLEQRHGANAMGEIIRRYNAGEPKLNRLISIITEVTKEDASLLERFQVQEFGTILEDIDWALLADILMTLDTEGNLLIHHVDDLLYPGGMTAGLTFPLCGDWRDVEVVEICFPQFGARFAAGDLEKVTVEGGEVSYLVPVWGWQKALASNRLWMRRHLIYQVPGVANQEGERWHLPLRFGGSPSQLRVCWRLILPPGAELEEVKTKPAANAFSVGHKMLVWEWRKPAGVVSVSVRWRAKEGVKAPQEAH